MFALSHPYLFFWFITHLPFYQTPIPTPAPATRSLFSSVDPDSGSDSDSGHPAIDAHDAVKAAAKRAYCETLLYKDYLYKQLCVGLLQNYQDLIKRLRTNTFHDAVTAEGANNTVGVALNIPQRRMNNREMFTSLTEVENESESSDDEAGGGRASKAPFCLGQAVEEYNYLKVSCSTGKCFNWALLFRCHFKELRPCLCWNSHFFAYQVQPFFICY